MLLELEKVKPEYIEVEKLVHIPRSEYQDLKNELNSIKISQSKSTAPSARLWLTEKSITEIEAGLNLKGGKESTVLLALDEFKNNKELAGKVRAIRQENSDLKKKLAELQQAPQ